MLYLMLIALASLIYAGVWMAVAPSRALSTAKLLWSGVSRFDGTGRWPGLDQVGESAPVRVAFRLVGLALISLSIIRLTEIA
jgi:hypothetical protein